MQGSLAIIEYVCGAMIHAMTAEQTILTDYKVLYNFLSVLDENQVYKLHKIASGMLNVTAFSEAEIKQLEKRLLFQAN